MHSYYTRMMREIGVETGRECGSKMQKTELQCGSRSTFQ